MTSHELDSPALDAVARALPFLDIVGLEPEEQFLARLRLALQLPRMTYDELTSEIALQEEVARVVRRILADKSKYGLPRVDLSAQAPSSTQSELREVPVFVAQVIHRCYHYIGWPREGLHLGLYPRDAEPSSWPVTLLTFSPFDLRSYSSVLPPGVSTSRVVVLSRAYSFRHARRNAFSYTFAKSAHFLLERDPRLAMILTYVNPNVGFTGSSYRASNWMPFAEEPDLRYYYLDHEYITERALTDAFGPGPLPILKDRLGGRLQVSQMPLLPLRLFAYPVQADVREELSNRLGSDPR